jgi:tagatose 6-phosphate kinase
LILVVSLNPALDLTYEVDAADWAGVNRPHTVHVRPGGKGVNVARTLRALGPEVRLAGLAGGSAGAELAGLLAGSGIELAFTPIAGQTRRTLTVVDAARQQAALFNEPGPMVQTDEYAEFVAVYQTALDECDAVVLSGSLPCGVADEAYAELIELARASSVPVILDTSGQALALGAAAGPTLIKPNLAELEELAGRSPSAGSVSTQNRTEEDGGSVGAAPAVPARSSTPDSAAAPASTPASLSTPVAAGSAGSTALGTPGCRYGDIGGISLSLIEEAARELLRVGARSVVVSLGPDGLLAVTGDGRWLARPEPVSGNPTGAGDAAVAGLADGLVRRLGWHDLLRHAVALGAATVAAPVAGEFVLGEYERQHLIAEIRIDDNSVNSGARPGELGSDLPEKAESHLLESRVNMQIHQGSRG